MRFARRAALCLLLPLAALGLLAACAPTATLNALAFGGAQSVSSNLAYGPEARQRLDVYTPSGAPPSGGWPVVVFFYGGSWNRGERAEYRFVGQALASRGVLTLVADYRLYPQVRYPEFLQDCAQALAFGLHEAGRFGGNPRRVYAMGHSAGAYNAAMLALDPRWLAATGHAPHELAGWIGLAGPYDFLPIKDAEAQPVFFHPDYPLGTQPIGYTRRDAPRGFLGAALDDDLVNPRRNTLGLAARLNEAGATVTLKVYAHVSHITLVAALARPLRWLAPVLDDVAGFVNGA